MTTSLLPISELELVGYIGQFQARDWPLRLLPVYRSPSRQVCLLPPVEESGDALQGSQVSVARLEELEDEGELTRLAGPMAARSNHLLWMDEAGPRYMPRGDAEKVLDERCVQAVTRALEAGLRKGVARGHLFRSLRARPTALAYALLSLHFQLQGDFEQTKPLREDLARMAGAPPTELEPRLVQLLTSTGQGLSREDVTAVAAELRRARREALAQSLLDAAQVRGPSRWAAQPAPEMSWSALRPVST